MKRTQQKVPGFDCRGDHANCPACKRQGESDHGISGGRYHWIATADEGDVAFSVCVYTANYPPTVDPQIAQGRIAEQVASIGDRAFGPLGSTVVHVAYPVSREQVLTGSPGPCDYIGQCYDGGASSDLSFLPFAVGPQGITFEQPEAFWLALEAQAQEHIARCREQRADREWMVCPSCHGDQTVKRGTPPKMLGDGSAPALVGPWPALTGYVGTCLACNIEADIGTEERPHPVPREFHTCEAKP